MATRLISLKIDHIAGVDRPANKRKLLIVKSEKIDKQMSIKKEGDKYCLYDGDKKVGEYDTMPQARAAMMGKSEQSGGIMLTKEQIAKLGDKELQEAVIQQQEEMHELEKKAEQLAADLVKAKSTDPEPKGEDVWKGVPAALRNRFEEMQKERDDWMKKAKEEKDERATETWTIKVKKFGYLQIIPEAFGKVMKSIAEHCPAEADEIDRILARANDIISKGTIFAEIGKNGMAKPLLGDATKVSARVEAIADELQKEDAKLGRAEAYDKVWKAHPEWYELYKQENSVKV